VLKHDDLSPLGAHRQALEAKRARLDRAIDALRRIEQHPQSSDALSSFYAETAWDRWETERQKRASTAPRAPDRASESRIALFSEIEAALAEDPASARARDYAQR
jgi:hypothetical protein